MSLTLTTAASGVARVAHYVVPTGQTQPIPTLLLEPQRTNLVLQSQNFSLAWTSNFMGTITPNQLAPDGTLTASILNATSTNSYVWQNLTFTGDGTKCVSVFAKAGTTNDFRILLRDTTAAVNLASVRASWSAGVPTLSVPVGTATLYPPEAFANGWWRLSFSVPNIIAANTNQLRLSPDSEVAFGTRNVLLWGAQAEDAVVPSSYIKTEGTVVTRNADSLYFPFPAPPQAMTVYVRGVEMLQGSQPADSGLVWVGAASSGVDPRFGVYIPAAANGYRVLHDPLSAVTSTASVTIEKNTLLECRAVLGANGSIFIAVTKNNGAEVISTTSAANPLGSAWADTRLWLNSLGVSSTGFFAYTNVVVAAGEQSRDTMRQLAGVV